MLRVVADLARNIAQLVYPNECLICDAREGEAGTFRHGLCTDCHRAVTTDPFPVCPWCAQTVGPHTDTANGCGECRGVSLGFERAFRLGPYEGKLRDAVLRTKVLAGEGLADLLGRTFVESRGTDLATVPVDFVCPIPLHWWRKWTRGYNQAEAIARELAAGLRVSFDPGLLVRTRYVTQHVQASRTARLANMKGAFRVRAGARVLGQTVLLVDDVMTTGSTVSEAARTLRAAGADRVVIGVLARR